MGLLRLVAEKNERGRKKGRRLGRAERRQRRALPLFRFLRFFRLNPFEAAMLVGGSWGAAGGQMNNSGLTRKWSASFRMCAKVRFRSPRRIMAPRFRLPPRSRERSAAERPDSSRRCRRHA